ncbi:MAG: PepSY domain-containing protein [Steroidobacterales bacterium]
MIAQSLNRRAILIAAACVAAMAIAVVPAFAAAVAGSRHQDDDQRKENRQNDDNRRQRSGMSLDEAVQRAERRYHARVVKAEAHNNDGRTTYVLRLVSDDGRVFTVRVDAQTGNMD